MRMSSWRAGSAAALALCACAAPAHAQDVQYRTITKVEMKGALGAVMKIAAKFGGGGNTDVIETTSIKGARMRTDDGKVRSTIIDLDQGRFTMLDHENKTYTVVTVAQMAEALDSLSHAMTAAQTPAAGTPPARSEGKAEVSFDLKVDKPGDRRQIAGANADRTFMTITTDIQYTPEGEEKAQDAGRIVMFVDQWNSTENAAWKGLQEFHRKAPAMFAREMGGSSAALASQPGMSAAVQKAAEEAGKIEGIGVLSTTYMVLVSPEEQFDRALAMNEKPEAKKPGIAESAAKGALGGLLGGRKKAEEPPKEEMPAEKQATMMVITQTLQDVKTLSLAASLFEVPSGYREITFGAAAR